VSWLDDPKSHDHQVSFCLVNTTNVFPNVVELRMSLTQSKNILNLKWSDMYSIRHNRRARNKASVSYSDDKPGDISNRQETLPTPSNKGME